MEHHIRKATIHDLDRMTIPLVKAFLNDSFYDWHLWQRINNTQRAADLFFKDWLQLLLSKGKHHLLVSKDYNGVALWYPPDSYQLSLLQHILRIPKVIRALGFGGLIRLAQILDIMAKIHPIARHYYLQFVAWQAGHNLLSI